MDQVVGSVNNNSSDVEGKMEISLSCRDVAIDAALLSPASNGHGETTSIGAMVELEDLPGHLPAPEQEGPRPVRANKWKVKTNAITAANHLSRAAKETYGDRTKAEPEEATKLPWYLIDLEGRFRICWDLMQVLVLAYVALAVPLRVAFAVRTWGPTYWVEVLVDVYFYIDIIINFLSVIKLEEEMNVHFITDLKSITIHYIKGWFVLDILACLPLDYVTRAEEGTFWCSFQLDGCQSDDVADAYLYPASNITHFDGATGGGPNVTGAWAATDLSAGGAVGSSESSALKLLKLLRIFRLLKLVRLTRVKRILDRYQDKMVYWAHLMTSCKVLGVLILTSHWLGCLYGSVFEWEEHQTLTTKWTMCFYWAVQTITTVGYGDLVQESERGMLLATAGMLVGGVIFSWFMSNVFSLINPDPNKEKQQETLQYVVNYLKMNNLPAVTAAKVLIFFRKTSSTYHFNEEQMLATLPFHLRQDIFSQLYAGIITAIPLFKHEEKHFIDQLCLNVVPVMHGADEFVYQRDQWAESMFILAEGEIAILNDIDKRHVLSTVLVDKSDLAESILAKYSTRGSIVGEGTVLGYLSRTEHVLCTRKSKLLRISSQVVKELVDLYPDVRHQMLVSYLQRLQAFAQPATQREVLRALELTSLLDARDRICSDFRVRLSTQKENIALNFARRSRADNADRAKRGSIVSDPALFASNSPFASPFASENFRMVDVEPELEPQQLQQKLQRSESFRESQVQRGLGERGPVSAEGDAEWRPGGPGGADALNAAPAISRRARDIATDEKMLQMLGAVMTEMHSMKDEIKAIKKSVAGLERDQKAAAKTPFGAKGT